jgi:hypothetical protein
MLGKMALENAHRHFSIVFDKDVEYTCMGMSQIGYMKEV